jgi:hypothetical protein
MLEMQSLSFLLYTSQIVSISSVSLLFFYIFFYKKPDQQSLSCIRQFQQSSFIGEQNILPVYGVTFTTQTSTMEHPDLNHCVFWCN